MAAIRASTSEDKEIDISSSNKHFIGNDLTSALVFQIEISNSEGKSNEEVEMTANPVQIAKENTTEISKRTFETNVSEDANTNMAAVESNVNIGIPENASHHQGCRLFPHDKHTLHYILGTAVLILYWVYFSFALSLNFHRAIPLLVITCIFTILLVRKWLGRWFKSRQQRGTTEIEGLDDNRYKPRKWCLNVVNRGWKIIGRRKIKFTCYGLILAAMVAYLVSQHTGQPDRLRPLLGLAAILLVCWVLSYDKYQINWRPVVWGLALQMCLGLITLTTTPGRDAFRFLGKQMEIFLDHVLAGVLFVFGEKYTDFFFIFKLMPIVIFLSSVLSVLYHLGVMQRIIGGVARVMTFTLDTTAAESTGTAACIFLGQPEASLTIRPFLPLMTRSELFAITTAGFASVTADVFAIFVSYGMPSAHIITAVLMSAPAGLAVAKVICPETEVSKTKDRKQLREYERQIMRHPSLLDAASSGAQDAVAIIVSVVASIIAFLSLLSFMNSIIAYMGGLVNVDHLSLEKLISYPLMPVSYLLGVAWDDCRPVAEVIGLKTFVNELVGYQRLAEIVEEGGIKHRRSEIIAMYALCGFSNPTTVGVTLGGLSAMVPQKREVLAKIILMSWLAGCLACFMTAAWAGLLYKEEDDMISFNTTTNSP